MIPHGNCRDATKSGCVVDQDKPVAPGHYYIMREFVLNDDFINDRRKERPAWTRKGPRHYILQILMRRR